jgi:capsular exopolysaccharide synthesis family protein
MIQSLGLGRYVQETDAEQAKPFGNRAAERLEAAVAPDNIVTEEVAIELLRREESTASQAQTKPAEEPAVTVTEKPVAETLLELAASAEAAVEPNSRKNGIAVALDSQMPTGPVEEPSSTVAEKSQEPVGLEHISPEEIAVEPLSRIVFHTDPSGLGADRFRYLRLRIRESSNSGKLKSILVTSPLPQDGKSTIALNLATALAERGENPVLLLEADLYQPVLATRLGIPARPGLAECFTSGLDPVSALRRVEPLGLYLLLGGKSLGNPGDFLHGDTFANVMKALTPHFKWIVIDSPPVAPLADTLALARHADASLLVVRAGQTPIEAVDAAIEALGAKHLLGVVLNGVEGLARRYAKYSRYYRPSPATGNQTVR